MRSLKEGLNRALSQKWLARYFLSSNTWAHLATKNEKMKTECANYSWHDPITKETTIARPGRERSETTYCLELIDVSMGVCLWDEQKIVLSYVVLFASFLI